MKKFFLLMVMGLLFAGSAQAQERIEGTLDKVYLPGNYVVVNGKEYKVNTELTQVLYRGLNVGEESLSKGDRVQLVFDGSVAADGLPNLLAIILLRGSKSGLDS